MASSEPRNPFYVLLLIASVLFVATALAYGIVPFAEDRSALAGKQLVPSSFSKALRADGWRWLLVELGAMTVFAFLSMGLDRLRTLRSERQAERIPPAPEQRLPRNNVS